VHSLLPMAFGNALTWILSRLHIPAIITEATSGIRGSTGTSLGRMAE
jgi:hypothetical protein